MLKKIGILLALVLVVFLSIILYLGREQSIEFHAILPPEFEVCGSIVDPSDSRYKVLKNWLKQNESGWYNSPVSYVPHYVYSSKSMQVNVMPSGVVVNYQENSSWYQVNKSAETSGLVKSCE